MSGGRTEYHRVDQGESPSAGDNDSGILQPRRGPEYAELDIGEPQDFGEDDDVRFYQEFSTFNPQSSKAQTWKRKRFSLVHILLVAVGCLGVYASISLVWNLFADTKHGDAPDTAPSDIVPPTTSVGSDEPLPSGRARKKLLTYDNVHLLSSMVDTTSLDWIAHPTDPSIDGLYRTVRNEAFTILKVDNATWTHKLADNADVIKAASGLVDRFSPRSWSVSADWEYMLFNVHIEKVWRHSIKGTYLLYNIKEQTMIPLTSKGNDKIQRVEWAPTGHHILFVRDNNLFVSDMMHEIQVTDDGNENVFNGIADWVYEEEVLGTGTSSWWSPDGSMLAYLRLDDASVPVYQYQLFHPDNSSVIYPDDILLHYPKPGADNPRVSLYVYRPGFGKIASETKPVSKANDNPDTDFHPHKITFESPFDPKNTIITNVAWLTDGSDKLLVYMMNRVQDHLKVYLGSADPKQLTAKVVRERNTASNGGDGAWIEITAPPIYVPAHSVESLTADGYIDVVENGEYTHLALFSPLDSPQPVAWLTSGDYDVISGSVTFNRKDAVVSFLSTQASSTKFNVYQVSLNGDSDRQVRALSPPTIKSASERINTEGARDGTYDAVFSAGAGYYILKYKGPKIPWQAVYSSKNPNFERVLNDNSIAQNAFDGFSLPTVEYFDVANDAGDKMNAMAIYPPDFDKNANSKYGVLFRVYGGPNSQQVSQAFSLDWHSALASQQDVPDMQWIVAVVDGRGTGHKGRKYRSAVSKQLGILEPADQAAGAKYFQKLSYVNPHRIAIWGWSYGGYTTSRAIERHSDVFRVGMAVAPVTSWRFYDTIYTERYMKTPEMNNGGYTTSSVNNITGFKNSKFLIQHGTGDDNVHLQNTLALADLLESNNVPGFEMAVYTDSDHGIYTHGVQPSLYARMTNFLFRSFHELENKQFDFWRHSDPNIASSK
ncbi:Dpp4p [Coemansia spiralis]|uniref:Dpp4p n=2 Tax=Coemansia TaxID=4863 RepID=A0A9W8L0N5_9FUNG|nr:dipeptidyl peptidase IV N-terminal region-domain-containing protein [Coemansia spiralis]KAJ1995574.1 Dpp4p [Coemansia umbellata]KAJ2625094.1 Dpp4p [Coemansia sp. RSA 1358]KAJ2679952.1 Dpp4p [Coemansia spiralis]